MLVFEMFGSSEEWPLTVFARNRIQADTIYAEWIRHHHPEWPEQAMTVYRYQGRELLAQAALSEAAYEASAGIGVWDYWDHCWVIKSPVNADGSNLFRPKPRIRYYRVGTAIEELMVFASNPGEAMSLYSSWHKQARGPANKLVNLKELSRWRLVLDLANLRDAMHDGVTGIARWEPEAGWEIVEPQRGQVVPEHLR